MSAPTLSQVLQTGVESSILSGDTDRILDGDLDEFIKAALVLRKKSGAAAA